MPAQIGIVLGSYSDVKRMEKGLKRLEAFEMPFEMCIASAHRTPERLAKWLGEAAARGVRVIIAGAGAAAHLPGVVASKTILPVIGVPFNASPLEGVDALYSIVQMPPGIPVATVGVDSAENAAILAMHILAVSDPAVGDKIKKFREAWKDKVEEHNARLYEDYPHARPGSPSASEKAFPEFKPPGMSDAPEKEAPVAAFAAAEIPSLTRTDQAIPIPITWKGDRRREQVYFDYPRDRRHEERRAKQGKKHNLRNSQRASDHYRNLDPESPDVEIIEQAVDMLSEGGIVAMPTDTVYGLAVDAENAEAVARLYEIKGRPREKPIPVLIDSIRQFDALVADRPEGIEDLMDKYWPGPLTLVARKEPGTLPAVSPDDTLGIRIPDNMVALGIISMYGGPLAVTSANLSNQPPIVSAQDVVDLFDKKIDLILDCGTVQGGSGVSTVLNVVEKPYRILREGVIARDALAEDLKDLLS